MNWAKIGLFAGGALFGSAGIEILTSKDAKKLYTNCTAAVLRAKKCVMDKASVLQENCEDIYADARQINEERAAAEEAEFEEIYNLDVISIPTNKPMIRKDLNDAIYKNEKAKFNAIVQSVKESHEKGQPVLIGTVSIEKSEKLSNILKKEGIKHEVLNAKYHEKEAEIIAQAGKFGAVTIATNMAGRGTDIKLSDEVRALGGLCVVGTGASLSANCGTVMINIIQSASVCALCCNQHPFLIKNAGIVQDNSRITPQYTEWSEIQLYVYAKFQRSYPRI